jgi:excisionase family DNA binding protein
MRTKLLKTALPDYGSELNYMLALDLPARPLSTEGLSDWLDCTSRFLEKEVASGRLRAVKLGRRSVRFLPSDVARWLNARASFDEAAA